MLLAIVIGIFSGLAVVGFRLTIDWLRLGLLGLPCAARCATLWPDWSSPFWSKNYSRRSRQRSEPNQGCRLRIRRVRTLPNRHRKISDVFAGNRQRPVGPEDPIATNGSGNRFRAWQTIETFQGQAEVTRPGGRGWTPRCGVQFAHLRGPVCDRRGDRRVELNRPRSDHPRGGFQRSDHAIVSRRRTDVSCPAVHPRASLGVAGLCRAGSRQRSSVAGIHPEVVPNFRTLPKWTYYFQPAAAGLLIGLIGLRIPQAMGTGYPYIDQALHSQYTWEVLALLGFAKILTTSMSFVSGTPGECLRRCCSSAR